MMIPIQIGAIIFGIPVAGPSAPTPMRLLTRLEAAARPRTLWLLGIGIVVFGLAELPALIAMSAHGTGVIGFERAGTTRRLNEILFAWGTPGRKAAEAHVFIDLGFIACYGLLLAGACLRLGSLYRQSDRPRLARVASAFAYAALLAASVNILQKLVLWLELHRHTEQPLPAIASWCAVITSLLALTVVLFVALGALAARRL